MTNEQIKSLVEEMLNKSGWVADENGNCTPRR